MSNNTIFANEARCLYNRTSTELTEFVRELSLDADTECELLTRISDVVTAAFAVCGIEEEIHTSYFAIE